MIVTTINKKYQASLFANLIIITKFPEKNILLYINEIISHSFNNSDQVIHISVPVPYRYCTNV